MIEISIMAEECCNNRRPDPRCDFRGKLLKGAQYKLKITTKCKTLLLFKNNNVCSFYKAGKIKKVTRWNSHHCPVRRFDLYNNISYVFGGYSMTEDDRLYYHKIVNTDQYNAAKKIHAWYKQCKSLLI